jgi:carboxylesterase
LNRRVELPATADGQGQAVGDINIEPFHLPAGQTGCLLLHGFTATPYDMRFLGDHLHAGDVSVCAVRLPGHASSPEDMSRHSWSDWVAGAREGLAELKKTASRVVVVGQSMGALLALKLAAEHPDEVDGVCLLSTALVASARWMYWVAPAVPVLMPLLPQAARFVVKGESDIADAAARAISPTYKRVAVRSIYELLRLQAHVRPLLSRIRQPALVIHSRQDHACSLENVAILQRELRGPVRSVILSDSYHVISVDVDKQRTAAEILAFVHALNG